VEAAYYIGELLNFNRIFLSNSSKIETCLSNSNKIETYFWEVSEILALEAQLEAETHRAHLSSVCSANLFLVRHFQQLATPVPEAQSFS